jgi:capsular polysaccharide biosynthesis protein
MELRTLWRIVVRRWWLIAVPSLAALGVAAYGYLKSPPGSYYASSIRFTAAPPGQEADSASYEDREYYPWLTSEYVVNGLTDWVKTSSFAAEVADVLSAGGLELPAPVLQANINADNERSVLVVYLSWHSAGELEAIARAVGDVLRSRSVDYFPQLAASGLQVVQLDVVSVGQVPPPLSARLEPVVRFGLGVAAGVALAFAVEYLDPTIRSRSEVEKMGLAVLAEVPRSRRGA